MAEESKEEESTPLSPSQIRRPGLDEGTSIDEDEGATMNFYILVGIAETIGIILIAMVGIWMGHYRGGFAWDGTGKEFNYHPVFMVSSMIFLYGNAALVYRIFRKQQKMTIKILHMSIQTVALVLIVLGLVTVFDFHNKGKIPNMYSLHSWLGLSTVILFCYQYLFGFLSFLWPTFPDGARAVYLKFHQFFGSAIFVLAIGACLTGSTEKLLFSLPNYSKFPAEGLLANVFGVMLVIFAGLIVHLVTNPAFKRQSDDQKIKYAAIH